MLRSRDYEHLSLAARSNRILVTHDREHFQILHGAWVTWARDWEVSHRHGGILIIEQRLHWNARQIGTELAHFVHTRPEIPNLIFRRTMNGWEQFS
jgi:hypothetical protein